MAEHINFMKSKIPTLGWVHFKEHGYVPCKAKAISVTITKYAGRYFASFVFEINKTNPCECEQVSRVRSRCRSQEVRSTFRRQRVP